MTGNTRRKYILWAIFVGQLRGWQYAPEVSGLRQCAAPLFLRHRVSVANVAPLPVEQSHDAPTVPHGTRSRSAHTNPPPLLKPTFQPDRQKPSADRRRDVSYRHHRPHSITWGLKLQDNSRILVESVGCELASPRAAAHRDTARHNLTMLELFDTL